MTSRIEKVRIESCAPISQTSDTRGKLVTRCLNQLRPHASYVRHGLSVSAAKLSALIAIGEVAFREPIIITQDGTIVDGYARVELARLQGLQTLTCMEHKLTEMEALCWLLQRHRRSAGLNAFNRILLALELEPEFKERARCNQKLGGQNKGSSNLTEAERIDVRSEIARTAGVSVGNVSKVTRMTMVHPRLMQALRGGEVSINRASLWSSRPENEQLEMLERYQSERGIKKTIRMLISQHQTNCPSDAPSLNELIALLCLLEGKLDSVSVAVVDVPGPAILLSRSLARALETQRGLQLI